MHQVQELEYIILYVTFSHTSLNTELMIILWPTSYTL